MGSLSSLIYGIIKQQTYDKIDFKSEFSKELDLKENGFGSSKIDEKQLFGLPPESLKFNVNEVLNFVNIDKRLNSYYYYFNLEYFKYSFIKKWLYLIPLPINSELRFKFDDKVRPREIEVIYGYNNNFTYHWFYKVKNFK
ncbi:hypothetical protein [Spiroplasma endosymbiont of Panorpa germanica]|uniref:hypothetical protein n=1 Tax=Spiroplasma endosymbiont of Panorpa germanica TaxID=3066314 RepID=UPI0030CE81FD